MLPVPMLTGMSDQALSVEATLATLQELINQSYGVNSDNSVDWLLVEQLAGDLLSQETKHFQVLVYWGIARLHHQGFSALTESAEQLTDLVEHYWEQALPPLKRLRGRLSAIEWWLERSITWLQQSIHEPLAVEVRDRAVAAVIACDRVLAAHCESAPVMASLINRLKQLEIVLPPLAEVILITPEVSAADPDRGLSKSELIPAADHDEGNIAVSVATDDHVEVEVLPIALTEVQPAVGSGVPEMLNQAGCKAAAGDYRGAVEQLQQGQKRLIGSDYLQLTCHLANHLREAGYVTLAAAQIQQALALVERHQLESWDPPLAQQVLESAFDLFKVLDKTEAAAEILARLCLLDAGRALFKSSTAQ